MSYQNEAKNYFSMVVAALIVVAIAVASLIYSFLKTGPEDIDTYVIPTSGSERDVTEIDGYAIEDVDGELHVDPASGVYPSGPPQPHTPTIPPPGFVPES